MGRQDRRPIPVCPAAAGCPWLTLSLYSLCSSGCLPPQAPPASPHRLQPAGKQRHRHTKKFQCFINKILQKESVFSKVAGVNTAWPDTRGLICGGTGSWPHPLEAPGPPCSLCQPRSMGYGLCAKIKSGGLAGHGMEQLAELPADSPPNLGTPSRQAERRTLSLGLLGLQPQAAGQHQGVGARGGGGLGLGDTAGRPCGPQEQRLLGLLGLGSGPPGRARGCGLSPGLVESSGRRGWPRSGLGFRGWSETGAGVADSTPAAGALGAGSGGRRGGHVAGPGPHAGSSLPPAPCGAPASRGLGLLPGRQLAAAGEEGGAWRSSEGSAGAWRPERKETRRSGAGAGPEMLRLKLLPRT